MTTGYIGSPTGNRIVPVTAFTKQTKQLTFTVTGDNSFSASFAKAIFYTDSTGNWRMKFNIIGTTSATTNVTLTFESTIVFAAANNLYVQAVGTSPYSATGGLNSGTNTAVLIGSSSTTWRCGGDVPLNAEPTTYTTAANMEGNVNVAAYIPSASAGVSGLVDNTSGNTTGTPIKGRTDGVAVSAGYVGEYALSGTSQRSGTGGSTYSVQSSTATNSGSYGKVIYLSLSAGHYLISIKIRGGSSSNTTLEGYGAIGGSAVTSNTCTVITAGTTGSIHMVFPVTLTTTAEVQGYAGVITGTPAGANHEMWVVRIG